MAEKVAAFDIAKDCVFCAKEASEPDSRDTDGKYSVMEIWHQHILDMIKERLNGTSDSDGYDLIKARINALPPVTDDSPIYARYHVSCEKAARDKYKSESELRGERYPAEIDGKTNLFMNFLLEHIAQSGEERRFSVQHITALYKEKNPHRALPARKEIKKHLDILFREGIVYHEVWKDLVFCLEEDIMFRMRLKYWEKYGIDSMTEKEKEKALKKTASVLLEEIENFDPDNRKSSGGTSNDERDIPSDVPPTLYQFLDELVEGCEEDELDQADHAERVRYLSHMIMSAVRPDSFSSPIMTEITESLRDEGCPKSVIKMLATLGMVAPLEQVSKAKKAANSHFEDDDSDVEESPQKTSGSSVLLNEAKNGNTNHLVHPTSEPQSNECHAVRKGKATRCESFVMNMDETGLEFHRKGKNQKHKKKSSG